MTPSSTSRPSVGTSPLCAIYSERLMCRWRGLERMKTAIEVPTGLISMLRSQKSSQRWSMRSMRSMRQPLIGKNEDLIRVCSFTYPLTT